MDKRLIEMVKVHEGLSLTAYRCPAGALTIGYGHNLDTTPIGIQAAETILLEDLQRAYAEARVVCQPFWSDLNDARKAALTDMALNLGRAGLAGFKGMLAAMAVGDYGAAAKHARNSRWARQVGGRSDTVAGMIETGQWPAAKVAA